jgi:hypothetical protein
MEKLDRPVPCPFCGMRRVGVHSYPDYDPEKVLWYVACSNKKCEAAGPIRLSKVGSVKAWNVRNYKKET